MGLFYDVLLPFARSEWPEWHPFLAQAIVVEVTNVGDFYMAESSREVWDLTTDFPNCAPPWPVAFFEWRASRTINSEGRIRRNPLHGLRYGVLIVASAYEERLVDPEATAKEMLLATVSHIAMEKKRPDVLRDLDKLRENGMDLGDAVWAEAGEQVREQYVKTAQNAPVWGREYGVKWACESLAFAQGPNGPIIKWLYSRFPLTDQGQFVRYPDGKIVIGTGNYQDPYNEEDKTGIEYLHVPLLATSFAHCKNVVITTQRPSPKLVRAREKKDRPKPTTYKILEIEPMRKVLKSDGGMSQGTSLQRALHICRGHFKDYRQHGLFGRNKGLYWWDMSVRGQKEAGLIVKDYKVKP